MKKKNLHLITIFIITIVISSCSVTESTKKEIISFAFQDCPASITYDFNNNTYRVVISDQYDISSLIPVFEISPGASINPHSGQPLDFTNTLNFTVTAEDGSSRIYTVIVNIEENKSLLIVDVQRGAFPVYNEENFLNNLNILTGNANKKNAAIVFVNQTDDNLTAGSYNWQIHDEIMRTGEELVVQKRHLSGFDGTTLLNELDQRKIGTVVIAGLATDFCIEATCRAAADLAYNVIIPSDAHTVQEYSYTGRPDVVIGSFNQRMENEGIGLVIPTSEVEF